MYDKKYWALTPAEVLAQFESSERGLNEEQAKNYLYQYGRNEIGKDTSKKRFQIFVSQFKNPLVVLLIVTSLISGFLDELINASIILTIIMVNAILGFYQEYKSEKALEKLRNLITYNSIVLRENEKKKTDTKELVPGDIVFLQTGDIVPADMRVIDLNDLSIDQSTLTGESYAVRKISETISVKDPSLDEMKNIVFMGTTVINGTSTNIVISTGKNTYLGRTAQLLKKIKKDSEFQKAMKKFSNLLIIIVLISVVLIFLFNFIFIKNIIYLLLFAVALSVGMVPEALPIVVTIALSNGALLLAKEKAVVKRLVSVEDFGNIDVICTDKTGTLTENKLTLEKYFNINGDPDERILLYSLLCNSIKSKDEIGNPLDRAIWNSARFLNFDIQKLEAYHLLKEIPFNSTRKKLSTIVQFENKILLISKGAPEKIIEASRWMLNESKFSAIDQNLALKMYDEYGSRGYRVIAIAFKELSMNNDYLTVDEEGLIFLGYLAFIDPPKASAIAAIEMCRELGIEIKILTGDGPLISKEIAHQIGLHIQDSEIILGHELDQLSDIELENLIQSIIIVSRATPEHKYRVVKALRKINRITACIGDGVNDAPALKEADVGIAVDEGSDIAKEAADIILLEKDLKVITDGIVQGRKTFSNIVKYLIYTISGNFGDLYTIGGASIALGFLPLYPAQILLANFLTDAPTLAISTDTVDKESLIRPRRWHLGNLFKLSGILGFVSSLFDILMIILLINFLQVDELSFRTALFLEIVLSEIVVFFMIRTERFFLRSTKPSTTLLMAALISGVTTFLLIYLPISVLFSFSSLNYSIALLVILIVLGYSFATELVKLTYFRILKKSKIKPLSKHFK